MKLPSSKAPEVWETKCQELTMPDITLPHGVNFFPKQHEEICPTHQMSYYTSISVLAPPSVQA